LADFPRFGRPTPTALAFAIGAWRHHRKTAQKHEHLSALQRGLLSMLPSAPTPPQKVLAIFRKRRKIQPVLQNVSSAKP